MKAEVYKSDLFRDLFREIWPSQQFLYWKKYFFNRFWVPREKNFPFRSKTQWQMFLLVSGRHVGAHPDGHQHGVSIQISINFGEKFLRISRTRKIIVTWFLARAFAYLPSFFSQILDLIYWTVLIFILHGVTLKTSNSTFRARWLASSEVISQVLFTSEQPKKIKVAFVAIF